MHGWGGASHGGVRDLARAPGAAHHHGTGASSTTVRALGCAHRLRSPVTGRSSDGSHARAQPPQTDENEMVIAGASESDSEAGSYHSMSRVAAECRAVGLIPSS